MSIPIYHPGDIVISGCGVWIRVGDDGTGVDWGRYLEDSQLAVAALILTGDIKTEELDEQ